MEDTTSATVRIESFENIDNDTIELTLKCDDFNSHGVQTLKCLDAMRKERQLCDVILAVEDQELLVHRAVLSCHSSYFRDLFLNDHSNASSKKQMYYQIDGVEYAALKLIIQFIYRGSFQLTSDMLSKVYLAAYQLRVETVLKACSDYLATRLNTQNCLSTCLMALDDDLRAKAIECIQSNFFVVLETREFHALPSIRIDLVGAPTPNTNLMCELILNWIAQQLRKDNGTIQELADYMHLLYLNGDKTLHDCGDMDKKNIYFSDIIKDYQSYKVSKRNLSTSSGSSVSNDTANYTTPNTQLVYNNLTSVITLNPHIPETKLIHVDQSSEQTYVAIAIVSGKMLDIAIHTTTSPPASCVAENEDTTVAESKIDDSPTINRLSPSLILDKDIPVSSLSRGRSGFGVVSTDDSIFVVGGYDRGDCLDTIERYDPIEGKWTIMPAQMLSRHGRVSATLLNNKIYVCGGSDGQQELSMGEYLDLKTMQKWMPIEDLPVLVTHGAMCNDENYVYLIGGNEGDLCKNDCYRYDPKTNQWSTMSPMHSERSQAAAVYYSGRIYVFGGYTSNRCLSSCEILSLSKNEWSAGPTMRECRRGCGAVLFKNKIFVCGGSNGVVSLTSIEIFNPTTNEWIISVKKMPNELNIPRVGVGITVCHDKLYAIGGFDGRKFLKSIEVYDHLNRRWKISNTNKADRGNHTHTNGAKV